MKKSRMVCAVFLCICLSIGTLTSCGGAGTNSTVSQQDELADDESKAYVIDYWIAIESQTIPKDLSLVQAEINKITQKKINATVKLHPVVVGDYDQRMQLTINAGDKFDLCFSAPWINSYSRRVALGGFYDITDLLPKYAPKSYALFDERIWSAARINGKIYGSINQQIMARTPGFSVDKEMLEKSGIKAENIKTLDDITPFLEYCYKNGSDKTNITQGYDPQGLMAYFQFDDLNGANCPGVVDVSSGTLKVINQFESEKFSNALKITTDWYKKGYIPADVLTKSFDFSKSYAVLMSTWKPSASGEDAIRRNGRETVCLPIGPSINYSNWIASTITAVSATSENPIRSIKFIELLNTDKELYNLLCFGMEGRHYEKLSENRIKLIPDSGYSINVSWEFGNQFNAYLTPGLSEDVWVQTAKVNAEAKYSPVVGFTFDPEPVRVEITNCQAVYTEFYYPLVSGVYGDKTQERLKAFTDKLRQSGCDKIIAEMQKQLDEWEKS